MPTTVSLWRVSSERSTQGGDDSTAPRTEKDLLE